MSDAAAWRLEELQRREAVLVAEAEEAQEKVNVLVAELEEAQEKGKVLARSLLDVRIRSKNLARNIEKGEKNMVSVNMSKEEVESTGFSAGSNVSRKPVRGLDVALKDVPGVEEKDFPEGEDVTEICAGGIDIAKGGLRHGDLAEVDLYFKPPAEVERGAVERLVLTLPLPHTTFRHPCLW